MGSYLLSAAEQAKLATKITKLVEVAYELRRALAEE